MPQGMGIKVQFTILVQITGIKAKFTIQGLVQQGMGTTTKFEYLVPQSMGIKAKFSILVPQR